MMTKTRQSLELNPEQWARLNALAASTESYSSRGPTPGAPSWRVLIARVADSPALVAMIARELKKENE